MRSGACSRGHDARPGAAHPRGGLGIGCQPGQGAGQCRRVARRHEQARDAVANDLGHAARRTGHDRQAGGARLQRHQPQRLGPRGGHHQRVRGPQDRFHVLPEAQPHQPVADAQPACQGVQARLRAAAGQLVARNQAHGSDLGQIGLRQGSRQHLLALPVADPADQGHREAVGRAGPGCAGRRPCSTATGLRGRPSRNSTAASGGNWSQHGLGDAQQRVGAEQPPAHQRPQRAFDPPAAGPDLAYVHHVRRPGRARHAAAAQHHGGVVVHHRHRAFAGELAQHPPVGPDRRAPARARPPGWPAPAAPRPAGAPPPRRPPAPAAAPAGRARAARRRPASGRGPARARWPRAARRRRTGPPRSAAAGRFAA